MKAILSIHAKFRLRERSAMNEQDFTGMLDRDGAASAGFERDTKRWHRVVYSLLDKQHYVAVQDTANGEVITILPLDYHENLAWQVSNATLKIAKKRAHWDAAPPEKHKPKFELTGIFWADPQTVTRKRLGTFRFEAFPITPEEVQGNQQLIAAVIEKMRAKDLSHLTLEEVLLFENTSGTLYKLSAEAIFEFSNNTHLTSVS